MHTWGSSDIMTYVALFNNSVRSAMRKRCGIPLTGYRALAYLADANEASPGDLAAALRAKPSTVSGVLKELAACGLIVRPSGPKGSARITDSGKECLSACDLVLIDIVEEFFEDAPPFQRGEVLSGSIATAVQHGVTRMRGDAYFGEYACLYGFSLSELIFKESARSYGLLLGEFRVLVEIHDRDKALNAEAVRKRLLMGKSEASRYISGLEAKDLIKRVPLRGDRRSSALFLTRSAELIIQTVRDRIDSMNREMIRPSNETEIAFSEKTSRAVVESHVRGH